MNYVWIFNGESNRFPSAVFTSRESAEAWVHHHALSGTLTKYPLDQSVYEWAVSSGAFHPKSDQHRSAAFIANFSSASQEHFRFENGE